MKKVQRYATYVACLVGTACGTNAQPPGTNSEIDNATAEMALNAKGGVCPPGTHVLIGTEGDDHLVGTHGPDCILGLGGDDTIDGLGGDDVLIGGLGNDVLNGGDGRDVLHGSGGDDLLDGDNNDDQLFGGPGSDILKGGFGNDQLNGGDGNDILFGSQGMDRLSGGDGNDVIYSGSGFDSCDAGDGVDTCSSRCARCENDAAHPRDVCEDDRGCSGGQHCIQGARLCAFCQADSECNDGNPCTDDTCHPLEGCIHVNNTSSCDDGNQCTQTDRCDNGQCLGSNPVVCVAADQCHVEGTCDPGTGTCSNPTRRDGTLCDDSNLCTKVDACQSGVCVGSDPVACESQDACHIAGTCDPATGQCSNPSVSCDDHNPCTKDGCNPQSGCVSVHSYGPDCGAAPPLENVVISDIHVSSAQLHPEQPIAVELTLEADAPRADYQVEFLLFPAVTAGDLQEKRGVPVGVRILPAVVAGSEKYTLELVVPAAMKPGDYVLMAHEYPEGSFVASGSGSANLVILATQSLPSLSIVKATTEQQSILVDSENTIRTDMPSESVANPFSGTLQIVSRNSAVNALPITATLASTDGSTGPVDLYFWDSQRKQYVKTLLLENLMPNVPTSVYVELAVSETDATRLRPILGERVPVPSQVTFAINADNSIPEAACSAEAPASKCAHSLSVGATLFLPSGAPSASAAPRSALRSSFLMSAGASIADKELAYEKSFEKFSRNDYIGAGLKFGGGVKLSKAGFSGHVEAAIPLQIIDNKFDFARATATADAPLDRNAHFGYKVEMVRIGTVVDQSYDEIAYEKQLDFPVVSYEKSFGTTIMVYCVPVSVFIGARGTFGVHGAIKAASSLGAANAATLDLSAGPYGDISAFAGAGIGAAWSDFKFTVGAQANLELVHADLSARGGGKLDILLNEEKVPVAIRGSLSESLDCTMNFLKGNIEVGLWAPNIEWCWKWDVIPYPCGFGQSEWTYPICSWPGYGIGPYMLLNKNQTGFEIPLPVCATCNGKCGSLDDGCGHQLECGGCAAPATCGGGGVLNVCGGGCAAPDCAGKCGSVPDSCGQPYNCGGCPNGMTCGGAGTANVCGVPPCVNPDCSGKCGVLYDTCGQPVNCGGCQAPDVCVSGECSCVPNLDCTGRCGIVSDGCYQQIDCGPCHDVGVIPSAVGCPDGSELIEIKMDDEDSDNANSRSGWNGAIQSTANTLFRFCRVAGEQFLPLNQADDSRYYYAVLKLSDQCPMNSVEFGRHFDNEDSDNKNWYTGNIFPNSSGRNTELHFCLYRAGDASMAAFPNLGFEYGVFAPGDFVFAIETGSIHTDDEDGDNENSFFGDSDAISAATGIVNGGKDGRNTYINLARVR